MKDIAKNVDKYRDIIEKAERYIWEHPETGFKEVIGSWKIIATCLPRIRWISWMGILAIS